MKTTKDYTRIHSVDNQTQIKLAAGSEISVAEVTDGLNQITTEKPCTKNGGKRFYISDAELTEITS
jgi:hypothetical protein